MKSMLACGAVLALLVPAGILAGSAFQPAPLEVTYVANEGVLLRSGADAVLIDAMHRPYQPEYAHPAPGLLDSLERALPPFDAVGLVLVTHAHRDHFDPAAVGRHLRHNPGAFLLASQEVADDVRRQVPAAAPQLRAETRAWKTRSVHAVGGVTVELLGLRHAHRRHHSLQHLGYVVHLGGMRVLHAGDAEMTEENFAPYRLDAARIDVALLPYWYLTSAEGRQLVDRHIRPARIVALHVPPREVDAVAAEIRAYYPEATVFRRSGEAARF